MSEYSITRVFENDSYMLSQVDELLAAEGLTRDSNLDIICAMIDDEGRAVATGSCFGQTLRCFAVSREHRGEGLLNELVSHLIELQMSRGNSRLFLYTKAESAKFFQSLGFYEIARVDGVLSFMENRKNGFSSYLDSLKKTVGEGVFGAVVMNANPFTLGHRYLVERAAAECDLLHLFVLSEDAGPIPFSVRKRLVERGVADIPNVILHESGPYIISGATFPSYFLKDDISVIENHAKLDLAIFSQIAKELNITVRFVGEEPTSVVTGRYNDIMISELPKSGIECSVIPRKRAGESVISASTVRAALKEGDQKTLEAMLPETTLEYFRSDEAAAVLKAINNAKSLRHY